MLKIKLGRTLVSNNSKTYFIADIAANHDGSLSRAKKLIRLCAKAGANAAKFQHFKAETIVSDLGFKKIGKLAHQVKWKKSVFDIYKGASINNYWNKELKKECVKNGIDFMTSPYDLSYVDSVNKYICAYKIGSGDITWHQIIKKISQKGKPVILATGASNLSEVIKAVKVIKKINKKIILMQCNTNYTYNEKNFNFINIKVLEQFKKVFKKNVILGLSDHTEGHTTVLGAVVLGAKVIEKHFTDNNFRSGPDHKFSMNPISWKKMVDETRRLEKSLGNGKKRVEKNEFQSLILQRRALRANFDLKKGDLIRKEMIIPLRPCPKNSLKPYEYYKIEGKRLKRNIRKGNLINIKCVI
jgi:N-acetylneuraminate synthase